MLLISSDAFSALTLHSTDAAVVATRTPSLVRPNMLRIVESSSNGEPRQLALLSPPFTYARLQAAVRDSIQRPSAHLSNAASSIASSSQPLPSPRFVYRDGDGELVTVSSQRELSEMMRQSRRRSLSAASNSPADVEPLLPAEVEDELDDGCVLIDDFQVESPTSRNSIVDENAPVFTLTLVKEGDKVSRKIHLSTLAACARLAAFVCRKPYNHLLVLATHCKRQLS